MLSSSEESVIQAMTTISGLLSFFACLYMGKVILLEERGGWNVKNGMLSVIFSIDLILSFFYIIGRSAVDSPSLCQAQGFFIQWLSLSSILWVLLMTYQLYQWIIRKRHPKRIEKTIKRNLFIILFVTFIFAVSLINTKKDYYADSTVWCWISSEYNNLRLFGFEIILLIVILLNFIFLYIISVNLSNRLKKSAINSTLNSKIINMLNSTNLFQRQLSLHILLFTIIWSFELINRFLEHHNDGEPIFITSFLVSIFLPLRGFCNALLYSGNNNFSYFKAFFLNIKDELTELFSMNPNHHNNADFKFKEIFVDPEKYYKQKNEEKEELGNDSLNKSAFKDKKQLTYVPKKLSIFTTTFNMGEAPLISLYADIKDWIIEGHDIYAIGLQECIDLNGIRDLILNHLGGPTKYAMYTSSIGSDNTRLGYHGFIALTVFVRMSEVLSGAIFSTEASAGTVATGTDLIITTAPNKGGVGIPLQIYDTNIGFVTCHLPSDSKGKSKLWKRNDSAHSILKEVILASEDFGFDLQFQHDHLILCGDLNYRMETSGTGSGVNSLSGVSLACSIEKSIMKDDPNWLSRKYSLLKPLQNHRRYKNNKNTIQNSLNNVTEMNSELFYPDNEELELIKEARQASLGAWNSVLRADELKCIMEDGDVFFGFKESLPCFPPSYKRKKGNEGDCGDYSNFDAIVFGYSNIGEVENMLEASNIPEKQKKKKKKLNKILKLVRKKKSVSEIVDISSFNQIKSRSLITQKQSENDLTTLNSENKDGENASYIDDHKNIDDHDDLEEHEEMQKDDEDENEDNDNEDNRTLLKLKNINEDTEETESDAHSDVNSEIYSQSDIGNETESSEIQVSEAENENQVTTGPRRNRRAAVVSKAVLKHELKNKIDPSKLRPPSYTDRVLYYSLPDKEQFFKVQAYDFCDSLRVSDHRAVSMVSLLEVNSAIIFNNNTPNVVTNPVLDETMVSSNNSVSSLLYNSLTSWIPFFPKKNSQNPQNTPPTKNSIVQRREPNFQLFELILTDISILLMDLNFSEAEEELMNDDDNFDATRDSSFHVSNSSPPTSPLKQIQNNNEAEETHESINPLFIKTLEKENEEIAVPPSSSFSFFSPSKPSNSSLSTSSYTSSLLKLLKNRRRRKVLEEKEVHSITILFPIPTKDPLIMHRRVFDYSSNFGLGVSTKPVSSKDLNNLENGTHFLNDNDREDLLKGANVFKWATSSSYTTSTTAFSSSPATSPSFNSPSSAFYPPPLSSFSNPSFSGSFRGDAKVFNSDQIFRIKGCASEDLGAHALIKFSNRSGVEFGSAVICLSHLIHQNYDEIHSSVLHEIPLSTGGQKRGSLTAKFSLRYIPSPLSEDK